MIQHSYNINIMFIQNPLVHSPFDCRFLTRHGSVTLSPRVTTNLRPATRNSGGRRRRGRPWCCCCWYLSRKTILLGFLVQSIFTVCHKVLKMMFWEIPPADLLILPLPTVQAGPRNLSCKNKTKHCDRVENTLCIMLKWLYPLPKQIRFYNS